MFERKDFIVDTRCHSVFGNELTEENVRFLRNYNRNYYYKVSKYLEQIYDESHETATLVRVTYCQALESMFSLMFSIIQAPHYVTGWFHRYSNEDLRSLLRKISKGTKIPTKFESNVESFSAFAEISHSIFSEKDRSVATSGFQKLWINLADEMLDDDLIEEYNSLKHGLRAIPGGSFLRIGREATFGVAPPAEEMRDLGGSRFGSRLVKLEPVKSDDPKKVRSYVAYDKSVNWNPIQLIEKLSLISFSIGNLVSFALFLNGDNPEELPLSLPEDRAAFDKVFHNGVSVRGFSLRPSYDIDLIMDNLVSEDKIRESYNT